MNINMCVCRVSADFVIFLLCCVSLICCYNVDTANFVRHTQPDQEMFGFSVAAHRERGQSWILVGAPKGHSATQDLEGIRRGGAVFRCYTTANDSCRIVEFDPKGDFTSNGVVRDKKSDQWLGATLHSSGPDGPVVACAPRYIWFTMKNELRRDPVGTCFVAKNDFQDISEYSPCRTSHWGYHRQGSCQAGFSAAVSKDGRRLFIGAPGSWYWQGQMYSINANAQFRYTPNLFGTFGSTGQVIQANLESRPAVLQTPEGSQINDDSYLGYSTAVGDFYNEGFQGIAAGMPRGDELRGKVQLYTWNLTNFKNITGTQMGSYFGYSVAAGDVDGDSLDDLIIGAPMFTLPNNEGKYEVGRVYVIYQRSEGGSFRRVHELDGFNSKSRFGLSVASLGDINLDGYGDFAVGAPYDGPSERGVVYIFHGSKNGVHKKVSQKITAEDLGSRHGLKPAFGFSLAGGLDLDGNDYPDTIIGSYLSNTVYYLKSRPVVKIDGYTTFLIANKEIVLEQKNCTLRDNQVVACTTFDTCFGYTGLGVPPDIFLDIAYVLDAKTNKDRRMFFLDAPNRSMMNETWHLKKDSRRQCKLKTVYISNDIRDKLNPLEVEVRYSMQQRSMVDRNQLLPIIDFTEPPVRKDSITVHKNCGPDDICIPDLSLSVKPNFQRYLLGSKEKLEFDIVVQNLGEDSFETTFHVHLPEGVDFNKVVEVDQKEVRVSCTEGSNNTINCDVGNPLPSKTIAHFKMEFKPYHKEGMLPSYDFLMLTNSTNPEDIYTLNNNKLNLSIPIYVNSTLHIHGKAKPAEIRYNITNYNSQSIKHENDLGPQLIHVYNIKNEGPSTINETEMIFVWPSATESGDDLMYLLEEPQVLGKVFCQEADANYKEYLRDTRKKTIWEALDTEQSKSETTSMDFEKHDFEGVNVEQGPPVLGKKPGYVDSNTSSDKKLEGGDGSFIHQERQKEIHKSQHDKGKPGTTVHVTEDRGRGGTVHTIKTTYNTSTPVITTSTTWKNTTTVYGPDGRIIKQETTSGEIPGGRQYGTSEERQRGQSVHISNDRQRGYDDLRGESGYRDRVVGADSYGGSHGTSREHHVSTSGERRYESGHGRGSNQEGQYGTGYRAPSHGQSHHRTRIETTPFHHQSGRNEEDIQPIIYEDAYSSEEFNGDPNIPIETQRSRDAQNSSGRANWNVQGGYSHGSGHRADGQSSGIHTSQNSQKSNQRNYDEQNRNWDEDYAKHGIGAAAFDHGFKTGGFDVDTLRGGNVDEAVSKPAGAQFETHSTHQTYDPDLGWISTAKSGSGHEARGHQQSSGGQWSTRSESRWSSDGRSNYNSVERDNVETEKPNYNSRHLGRRKRQTKTTNLNAENIEDVIECQASKCKMIKCVAGPLMKNEDITVGFRWRVDVRTLQNISESQPIKFSSMAFARISKVPYIGSPLHKNIFKHEIVTTVLPPEPEVSPSIVPLWVVVLSAVAGVIILLLLAFLLYKCGFFKRNRVSDAPERQPLNKNGHYYNGDEAL